MLDEELGAEMSSGVGLAGGVLREGRTILLSLYDDLDQPTLPELAEHSVICVPLRWGEEMIGFFRIGAESPHRFNERDVESLELFAQYATVAIHNAHLFESSRNALDEMRLLKDGVSLGAFQTPIQDAGLFFLGVAFPEPVVFRVQIRYGTAALGLADSAEADVAVMDNFIYGEPQPLP